MAYYFCKEMAEGCWEKKTIVRWMREEGIKTTEVVRAIPDFGSGFFWCDQYYESGESANSECGTGCDYYKPRNGKSGRCIHSKSTYEPGQKETFIIKLKKDDKY